MTDPLGHTTTNVREDVAVSGHAAPSGNLLSSTNARSETTKYHYDCDGNLIQQTDARNGVTGYSYDSSGHLLSGDRQFKPPFGSDKKSSVTSGKARLHGGRLAEPCAAVLRSGRAWAIHDALDPIAQDMRATAVLNASVEGEKVSLAGSGGRDLNPAQRAAAEEVGAIPTKMAGAHAEVTVVENAKAAGATPTELGVAGQGICEQCRAYLEENGATIVDEHNARSNPPGGD